jgi:hypothetical protein
VSESSEYCHSNPLCCFSMSVYCCKHIFRYDLVRELLDTPSYLTNSMELTVTHIVKALPTFHGIRKYYPVQNSSPLSLFLSQLNAVNTRTPYFFKIHFNNIPPSPKWTLHCIFSDHSLLCSYRLCHACHIPRPSRYPGCD